MDPWHVVEIMAGALGVIAMGISHWALVQVVAIGREVSALGARLQVSNEEVLRRLDEMRETLNHIVMGRGE